MAIETAFVTASGPSLLDCHILSSRFDRSGLEEGKIEFLVIQGIDGIFHSRRIGNYRDLWRSPAGTVYTACEDHVSWCPDAAAGKNDWHNQSVSGLVTRITGVGEDLVFAFGHSEKHPIHRFDGTHWSEDAAPGWLLDIHGSDPELVYGVGRGGLIARWDQSGWTAIPTETTGVFKDVFVASADEMYAIHEQGLWEGSVNGWQQRLSAPQGDLLSVAVWREQVWVASRSRGLCTLDGTELTVVKDNLAPTHMDPRGDLLLCQHDKVGNTANGEKFQGWRAGPLSKLWVQARKPYWL